MSDGRVAYGGLVFESAPRLGSVGSAQAMYAMRILSML